MKALILAAGFGSRLAPITDKIPKSLVQVNGKPILFKQIENLHENSIYDITIISGYKAKILEKAVHEKWPEINIIESTDYATTNNMFSAYIGLKEIGIQPILMMNADVFYDASVIEALLVCPYKNAVVVDIGNYNEESMKVIEKNGRLVEISKTVNKNDALGSSIDVYKFDVEGSNAFYNKCKEYILEKGELKKWSEVALNDIFSEIQFKACPLKGRWYEIDNHDDLSAAEKLFMNELR